MGLGLKLARVLSTFNQGLVLVEQDGQSQPNQDADGNCESRQQLPKRFGARRVCEAGLNLIKHFEGLRLEAYHDAVGYPTQGYGHLLSRIRWEELSKYPPVDEEGATVWLENDLRLVCRGIEKLLPLPLNDNEFAALASFAFNLGLGALEASTLRKKLLRGDRDGGADEFLRWDHAGGRKLAGLTRRRRAERALFLTR